MKGLNARYAASGVYSIPPEAAVPYYGPLDGRTVSEFSRLEFDRGMYRYRGGPLDPFRRTRLFEEESILRGVFQHAHSAEFFGGVNVEGYPFRYYRSRSGKWAALISNGPDERSDVGMEEFSTFDREGATREGLFAELSSREPPTLEHVRYDDVTLLYEGEEVWAFYIQGFEVEKRDKGD